MAKLKPFSIFLNSIWSLAILLSVFCTVVGLLDRSLIASLVGITGLLVTILFLGVIPLLTAYYNQRIEYHKIRVQAANLPLPKLVYNDDGTVDYQLHPLCRDKCEILNYQDRVYYDVVKDKDNDLVKEKDVEIGRLKSALYEVKKALEQKDIEYAELKAMADTQAAQAAQNKARYIPTEVKNAVLKRDGWQCVICGSTASLQFDHIIPVAKGGGNSVENIQLLCQSCNGSKGSRII